MKLEQLEDALGQNLDQRLQECCSALEQDMTIEQQESSLVYVDTLRRDFLAACRDVEDEQEVDYVAAIKYIEAKSAWIMLNTQMNYQMAMQGQADMIIMLRGSLVSQFLASLEPLLDPAALDQITDFLSQPISQANR